MLEVWGVGDWPLAGVCEPGVGFHIGDRDWHWQDHGDTATCGSLVVTTSVRRHEHALVIERTLTNRADTTSAPINTIRPLVMRLKHPPAEWSLLHAHGGTTESYSPPQAFTNFVRFAVHRQFRLTSQEAGRSSDRNLPLLIGAARGRDEGFFCGLEWSGRWQLDVNAGRDGAITLQLGVPVRGAVLEPGETLALPPAHFGVFAGDLAAGSNALRRHIYHNVMPTYQDQPTVGRVSYDHWFGLNNDFDVNMLKAQADRAAELGVEVFVHDAAWFEGGFPHGVGNWSRVDRAKHPDGLEDLAEYVRGKGMDFGLWFEIERAGPATEALTRHPELFVSCGGDHHLNLALREAQDWAIETVSDWIARLDLRWSRWDYNIDPGPFWQKVDPTGKIQFDYMHGLYRVLDTLRARHPQWMVETCASGGRRLDLGTLRRAHTAWVSDHTELPYNCRYMQARANRFLPGCLLNSSVAVDRDDADAGFDDTAMLSRMLGKLSFDGAIANWSSDVTRRYAKWVDTFKELRHLMVQDFHQLLPQPRDMEDSDVVQFRSRDGKTSAVFAFAGSQGLDASLSIPGLQQGDKVTRLPDDETARADGCCLDIRLAADEAAAWRLDHRGGRL